MCGIVGFIDPSLGESQLWRALGAIRHRGPDGAGVHHDAGNGVGLGHARLAIIDLETGAQPLYSEDRDIVLVCNGEIYDFERLRADLQQTGHRFASVTDSEVIIHLYQEHGPDFIRHLRGEFAFLLYHRSAGRLLAVRDRFGIKPLFFSSDGGTYLFASEAKALFAMGALQPRIDPRAIRDCLSGVLPASIFAGVEAVPPGCLLQVDLKRMARQITRYWDLNLQTEDGPAHQPDLAGDIKAVRDLVEEAVRLRLRADVPVGVYLSGGIDSAIVTALAARHRAGKLKAFTVCFPEDEAFDESDVAKRMAEKAGAEFHSVACGRETLIANLEHALWAVELPFFNLHGVGKFLLSRLARQHVAVVLTGEGSDETFLGYPFFQAGEGRHPDRHRTTDSGDPSGSRTSGARDLAALPGASVAYSPAYQWMLRWLFSRQHRRELRESHPRDRLRQAVDQKQLEGLSWVRRLQYVWIKNRLTPYLLTILGDRSEMAHSIEGRLPFLDHELFERARRIPDGFKLRGKTEKYVLREAFRGDVTEEIYQRKKWVYLAPPLWVDQGYSGTLDALMEKHLTRSAILSAGIFNPAAIRLLQWVKRLVFFDCGVRRALNALVVFALTTQVLARQFVQDFEGTLTSHPGPSSVP